MRIPRSGAAIAGLATIALLACLTTPEEPNSGNQALNCTSNQRVFNGACRDLCATNAGCPAGQRCMVVGADQPLCLDFQHCAYLGSDTTCSAASGGFGGSYDPYWRPSSVYSSYGYGYSAAGCVGDAAWQVTPATGDPACGQTQTVVRCRATPTGCALVSGSTMDLADP